MEELLPASWCDWLEWVEDEIVKPLQKALGQQNIHKALHSCEAFTVWTCCWLAVCHSHHLYSSPAITVGREKPYLCNPTEAPYWIQSDWKKCWPTGWTINSFMKPTMLHFQAATMFGCSPHCWQGLCPTGRNRGNNSSEPERDRHKLSADLGGFGDLKSEGTS